MTDAFGSPAGLARRTALAVVQKTLSGAFLSRALGDELAASGLTGQDRSFVTDLTYGTVRRLLALDARLEPFVQDPSRLPAAVLNALRIGTYELVVRATPAYAAVDAWVEVSKSISARHVKLVNAVLRRVAAAADRPAPLSPALSPERDLSLPTWLFDRFVQSLGHDAAMQAARGMLEPEPLWLTAFGPRAEEALLSEGAEVREGPSLPPPPGTAMADWPRSIAVRSPVPLQELAAFRDGLVQPQNPASLYVAMLLGAGPGDLVYDLAAGHGIKTATLAAGGAKVVAVELSERRSRLAARNLRRLGFTAQHVVADLTTGWPGAGAADADGVLLDAPCSGTGTLRGNPEIKLRLKPEDLPGLAELQSRMLAAAALAVSPGGTLVYAVCSLMPEEGVGQVEGFLAGASDFEDMPMPEGAPIVSTAGPGAYVLPVAGLDGFYIARLRRRE